MNRDNRIIYPYKIANIQNNYNKIVLIQQYYIPKDEHRLEELNKCLDWNLKNPLINEIHLLNEVYYDLDILHLLTFKTPIIEWKIYYEN